MTASNEREYLESLRQTKNLWREKLAFFQKEYAITDGSGKKFELQQRIEECQQKIEIIDKNIESLVQEIEHIEKITRDIKYSQQEKITRTHVIKSSQQDIRVKIRNQFKAWLHKNNLEGSKLVDVYLIADAVAGNIQKTINTVYPETKEIEKVTIIEEELTIEEFRKIYPTEDEK